jgi:hypothetical protein
MYDPVYTAKSVITEWELTLGALPPAMRSAADLFAEADYAMPAATHFPLDGCTIANISAKIDAHAQTLAVAAQHDAARKQARAALGELVVQAASDAVPMVIESWQPEFTAQVAKYQAAVEALPERFTADQLLGSEDLAAAHKAASEAAQAIKAIDHWLGRTADLPGYITTERSSVLRVVAATNRSELQALLDATTNKTSPAELKVEPTYRVAADLGLTFRMATQAEAENLRRDINAMPAVKTAIRFASVNR